MAFRYLNTDLDLVSPADLSGVAAALGARGLFALYVTCRGDGLWSARFETEDQHPGPVSNIEAMLGAVESLDESDRAAWRACTCREFNVGYGCGASGHLMENWPAALLRRMGEVGASLGLTLYPPDSVGRPT